MDEKLFYRAVKNGDLDAVRNALAENPALVSIRDVEQSTPLHYAAWKGHAEVLVALLDAGADIHAHNQNDHWGTTALHAAAHANNRAIVEILLQRGADVNSPRSNSPQTPLDETKAHKATAAAKVLIAAGGRYSASES